ncbi:MAG: amidohydrolase family protein [Myxococcota bacterium]
MILAFVDVDVLPMDSERVLRDQTVLVADGRVAWMGPSADAPPVPAAVRVDGEGRTLLPGLADMHVHLFDARDLPLYLAAGVTTVLNMSGSPAHLKWRDDVARGALAGPRVVTTGPMIEEQGDPIFGLAEAVESEVDAWRVVGEQARAGYDFLKIHGDLEVGLYDAVMDAAAAHRMRVLGHVSERVGLLHAMRRRQASVEHTEELVFGFFNGRLEPRRIPVAVDAIRAGGAVVTPTLVSMDALARMLGDGIDAQLARPENRYTPAMERADWPAAANPYRARMAGEAAWMGESLGFQSQLVAALRDAGVPLLAGTDAGWLPFVLHGDGLHDELDLLQRAGLSRWEALSAATREAGEFLGDGSGVVRAGAPAELLLVDGDPLAPGPLKVAGVATQGRWHDRDALDALRPVQADEPVADAFGRGDVAGALRLAKERANALSEGDWRLLALRLAQADRFPDVLAVLRMATAAKPASWELRACLAGALEAAGRADEARLARAEADALRTRAGGTADEAAGSRGIPGPGFRGAAPR